jgi:hypothetical protein
MSKIRSVRQRTGAPRQDEGPSTGAALLAGAVLGLATDAVALALPRQQAWLLSAAHLAAAGGVYLGFAVADGRRSALLVQTGEPAPAVRASSSTRSVSARAASTRWSALACRVPELLSVVVVHRGRGGPAVCGPRDLVDLTGQPAEPSQIPV